MAAEKRVLVIILVSVVCLHMVFAALNQNAKFLACIEGAKQEKEACKVECHNLVEEKDQIHKCFGDCKSFLLANFDKCKAAKIK